MQTLSRKMSRHSNPVESPAGPQSWASPPPKLTGYEGPGKAVGGRGKVSWWHLHTRMMLSCPSYKRRPDWAADPVSAVPLDGL